MCEGKMSFPAPDYFRETGGTYPASSVEEDAERRGRERKRTEERGKKISQ
jgi:hypothetical protein